MAVGDNQAEESQPVDAQIVPLGATPDDMSGGMPGDSSAFMTPSAETISSLPLVEVVPLEAEEEKVHEQPRDGDALKPELRRLVRHLVKEDQVMDLWQRASEARKQVDEQINDLALAEQLYNKIRYARNELLAGEENYEDAERAINEVEYRVSFTRRVARWSASLGTGLFLYETAWALVLLLFLFLGLGPGAFSSTAPTAGSRWSPDVVFLLGSMTWGGLGGVIGAWISLIHHISHVQDFDRQHTIWYINSPVMGIGVGAVTYLVLRAGLLSLSGPGQDISSPLIIYLVSWLVGYQQNVFTDMVKRLIQVFRIEEEKPSVEQPNSNL